MATGAAGVTIRSRLTLAGELSWMNVFYSRQETSARLTMLTARMGTRRGLLGKVGFGKGRLTVGPGQLVDDKPAWLIGGEYCALSRVDACAFLDYSQTGVGSPRNVSVATVHYRMHALRFGLTARLHLLRGRRITLPPRA